MSEEQGFYVDDTEEFDPFSESSGGKYLGREHLGWGHFIIEGVEEPAKDGDDIKVTLLALAPESWKDKTNDWYLKTTGGMKKRTLRFAAVLGLFTREQFNEAKEQRTALVIPWKAAVGMSFCGEREDDSFECKENREGSKYKKGDTIPRYGIGWNFMSSADGQQKGHPVDPTVIGDPFVDGPDAHAEQQEAGAGADASFEV